MLNRYAFPVGCAALYIVLTYKFSAARIQLSERVACVRAERSAERSRGAAAAAARAAGQSRSRSRSRSGTGGRGPL